MHELDDKSTPRRRGRPKGSRGQVERAVGLRLHDFAFMRAVAQGVAPDAAAERYMPDGQTDVRTAKALYRRLIAEVVAQLDGFADVAVASQAAAARLALQLDDEGVSTPRAPSLDDFAAEFDADGFSERELLEMYQERYGSALEAAESVEARVRALNWLQPRLARVPGPADPVTAWLGASVSTALRGAGVLRLEELLALLRVRGRSWYRRVPSIGRDRARRIEAWLSMHEEQLGAIVWPAAHLAAAAATLPSMYGAISAQLREPGNGSAITNNAIGARSDSEALSAWSAKLDRMSPHTRSAYVREVRRFLLWLQRERRKELSQADLQDAMAFQQYLVEPSRSDRASLTHRSANRAAAAVGSLYRFLAETGYLPLNPFGQLPPLRAADRQVDTLRTLSADEVAMVWSVVMRDVDDADRRRLIAILLLLQTAGLRREELVQLTCANVVAIADAAGQRVDALSVIGKGYRERIIPLHPEAALSLRAHGADWSRVTGLEPIGEAQPLIFTLHKGPHGGGAPGQALSASGLHAIVRSLFRRVAREHPTVEAFQHASCHWWRHTFAHQILRSSGGNLPVVQQLLGHASLSTTGIYLATDVSERAEAINRLPLPPRPSI